MEKRSPQRQQPEAPDLPITSPMNRSTADTNRQRYDEAPDQGEPIAVDGRTEVENGRVSKETDDKEEETIENSQDPVAGNAPTTGDGHASATKEEKTGTHPGKAMPAFADPPAKKSPGGTKKGSGKDERILPKDFKPTPYSVIIGRGQESKDHASGNQRLRALVAHRVPEYANAVNRISMSKIVSSVVAQVREACSKEVEEDGAASSDGSGAFVRLGKLDGRWYEVSDAVAREKVGYTFREMLGDRYRSSSQSKVARKRKLRGQGQICKGQGKQPPQQQVLKPRGHETSQHVKSAPKSPWQQEHQDAAALLEFGDESSTAQQWPQSISPHQIPPPGFILLEGAETPRDFFGPSSSGSTSSNSPTKSHTKQEDS